jgi:hypothetical protein
VTIRCASICLFPPDTSRITDVAKNNMIGYAIAVAYSAAALCFLSFSPKSVPSIPRNAANSAPASAAAVNAKTSRSPRFSICQSATFADPGQSQSMARIRAERTISPIYTQAFSRPIRTSSISSRLAFVRRVLRAVPEGLEVLPLDSPPLGCSAPSVDPFDLSRLLRFRFQNFSCRRL